MEALFSTQIAMEKETAVYRVVFENEQYNFIPDGSGGRLPAFSLKRENDEWHEQDQLPPGIKAQAIEALEKYLLQQH